MTVELTVPEPADRLNLDQAIAGTMRRWRSCRLSAASFRALRREPGEPLARQLSRTACKLGKVPGVVKSACREPKIHGLSTSHPAGALR